MRRYNCAFLVGLLAVLSGTAVRAAPAAAGAATSVQVSLDARAAGTPFPHFWEQMFGSGRAVLALRDDYRADLSQVSRPRVSGMSAPTASSTMTWACSIWTRASPSIISPTSIRSTTACWRAA